MPIFSDIHLHLTLIEESRVKSEENPLTIEISRYSQSSKDSPDWGQNPPITNSLFAWGPESRRKTSTFTPKSPQPALLNRVCKKQYRTES